MDFMGYKKQYLETRLLKNRIVEMGKLGVKSIMYAGEGEPFLHKDLPEIIVGTKQAGIDVGITTNGVLMHPDITEEILTSVEWIKVSLNAGSPKTYASVHGTGSGDFDRVISNLEYAVGKKEREKLHCALGVQILMIPENVNEVENLARISRDVGVDYLVVKPYTHHEKNQHEYQIRYQDYKDISDILDTYESDDFSVIFRENAMKKWDEKQHYFDKCICLPFWAYIDSKGSVWGCLAHLLEDEFNFGSITSHSFREIWEGPKRMSSLKWVEEHLDISSCKLNCRMSEVNRYLNELVHPPEHVNFI
jgi:MoaA/NifB/PqqE/SkfB family radical SAM enzyme